MTTVVQVQRIIKNVRSDIDNRLRPEYERLKSLVDNGAGSAEVRADAEALIRSLRTSQTVVSRQLQALSAGEVEDVTPGQIDDLQTQLRRLNIELEVLESSTRRVIAQGESNDKQSANRAGIPKESAGAIVANDKTAQGDRASVVSPSDNEVQTASERASNATTTPTANNTTLGATGSPSTESQPSTTLTTQQSQTGPSVQKDDGPQPVNDSVATASSTQDRPSIAPSFLKTIEATDNRLAGLASTSYGLSVYVMNQQEYKNLLIRQKKVLPSRQLLIQSGGAAVGERNKFFDVDFYIEDLSIESLVGTQEVGSSHNATNLEMKVVEPYGITFIQRLKQAALEHAQLTGVGNELSQTYLLVIRFFGYDQDGNLVNARRLGLTPGTDPDSIMEKFIPFHIGNITYTIANRATEYTLRAVTPQTNIALSLSRGTIPFNLTLSGETAEQILAQPDSRRITSTIGEGEEADETDYLDPNTAPADIETYTGSLCGALNKHQQKLVSTGRQEFADRYDIVFENAKGLKDAKLAKPGRANKQAASPHEVETAAQKFLNNKLNYDKKRRTWGVQAGTQIIQLIDLVIRSSSYITSQQRLILDETTGEIKGKTSDVDVVQWYRVRCQVEPIGYDTLRNDYAYNITYVISRYKINTPLVQGFPKTRYLGVHKQYDYWFTGENSEVLDFQIEVNANYLTPINQANLSNDPDTENDTSSPFQNKKAYGYPNASQQGGVRNSTILAANLADRLYNPVDVAYSNVQIVGDPDWIQQSEILYNNPRNIDLNAFMPDGSVNYDAMEVLYEIKFVPVTDYNVDTGLSDVYTNGFGGIFGQKQQNLVFQAARVTNYFRKGMFSQDIKGFFRHFRDTQDGPQSRAVTEVADDQQSTTIQPITAPKKNGLTIDITVPVQERRLQSNGNTTNFNIDTNLPFRDLQVNGVLTRVYGSERDLLQYYGDQAVAPKPGSTVISDDAGDTVSKGS